MVVFQEPYPVLKGLMPFGFLGAWVCHPSVQIIKLQTETFVTSECGEAGGPVSVVQKGRGSHSCEGKWRNMDQGIYGAPGRAEAEYHKASSWELMSVLPSSSASGSSPATPPFTSDGNYISTSCPWEHGFMIMRRCHGRGRDICFPITFFSFSFSGRIRSIWKFPD